MTTTAIEPTAAPLQLTTWERPGHGTDPAPGLRPALLPPAQWPGRSSFGRLWRFLTAPRAGIHHAEFFAPYGRPHADRPRPWC